MVYLGNIFRPRCIEVASQTKDGICAHNNPSNQLEIRSFMGSCNVFRRFKPNFVRLAAPLNNNLRKGHPSTFQMLNEKQLLPIQFLKNALISQPVLALFNPFGLFSLETDACDVHVGCVLHQEQPE